MKVVSGQYRAVRELPDYLAEWELPPNWSWGQDGISLDHRHYQEVIDALGRSLSLVSAPDPAHTAWLVAEAKHLAHRNHPAIPTTYHYWPPASEGRGPAYLRRWIAGETLASRLARVGPDDVPYVIQLTRAAGSALAYLHGRNTLHGALSAETVCVTPTGRLWLLGWEWAMPRTEIPAGLAPAARGRPNPPEWMPGEWSPAAASDQWQLAATAFRALTGEYPPRAVPPLSLVRPDCPQAVCDVIDKALSARAESRFHSVAAMLKELDRAAGSRTSMFISGSSSAAVRAGVGDASSEEYRLRWATGEDYEVLARLGSGTFGSVWRVRDLTLEREVALKMLHPHVSVDDRAVRRFRREAQLAGQLAHPAIVPVYDWDSNGEVVWYTMELAEGGSLADLVARSGPRPLAEIALQVEQILDGLATAHANGIIHRDLKTENILVDRYRRWRIADFGVAKIPGEDLLGTTGTPEFAAPEQLLGEQQGPAADCFGVAAIVFYLLTGHPPFGAGDAKGILARQLSFDIDLQEFPSELGDWLRRGLDPMPEHRFADAVEMQTVWRQSVLSALENESRQSWWTRLFSTSDAGAA
ncbi:MAG: protein kinase [Gemmatimonadaceae bacterium]